MAELPAIGDLREFEERCGSAIGIEHFGAVEFAIAVHRREGPAVTEGIFGGQVHIVDFALEPELAVAQCRLRIGGAAQECVAEGIGGAGRSCKPARYEGSAAVALAVEGANQIDREIGVRGEAQRAADAQIVLRIEFFLLAGCQVLDIAVAGAPFEGDPSGEDIRTRVDIARQQRLVVIAVAAGQFGGKALARSRGNQADRAHRRSGAEQRRLRALDHLDPVEIVDRLIGAPRARNIDAVVIERDARTLLRGARIRGDPADDDPRIVGALLLDVEPGDIVGEFVEIGDTELADPLAGERRDGDRHIDRALFDLLRGDDDLIAANGRILGRAVRLSGGLRKRRGKRNERGRRDEEGEGGASGKHVEGPFLLEVRRAPAPLW